MNLNQTESRIYRSALYSSDINPHEVRIVNRTNCFTGNSKLFGKRDLNAITSLEKKGLIQFRTRYAHHYEWSGILHSGTKWELATTIYEVWPAEQKQ